MEEIPDKIISRAVELWCRKLFTPVFDNGDNTSAGGMGHTLSTMNIQFDKAKISNLEKKVEVFRKTLTENLIDLRDADEYFPRWLDVDYHPCKILARAADEAGIPHSQFSCKSSVSIYLDRVSTSFGYGGGSLNHYPLADGRWLITTIYGGEKDMNKIFNHVIDGNSLGFEVEEISC